MNVETLQEKYTCSECGTTVKPFHRFCHSCGDYLGDDAEHINIFNNTNLQGAFFFFIIYLFICLIIKFTNWFDSYDRLFWVEILLAVITILYAKVNWANIKPLLRFNNFKPLIIIAVITLAVSFSLLVNVLVTQLNVSVYRHDTEPMYNFYRIYTTPILIMIYSIAVMPALFEELAFRGVMYNYLNIILDEKMVVVVTAFAFGMLHLSFISLVWLIPFGILLAQMRRKYQTIWYGIIFHFTFNLVACLYDLHKQGLL
ncbi:MAG TPA: CPBP family glutamic-type intramembrane protease [Chitinophagaceae bacterium]|nr:CPBP family glutamic-type intramembrane protease [Chitinophagaceae bacterium]